MSERKIEIDISVRHFAEDESNNAVKLVLETSDVAAWRNDKIWSKANGFESILKKTINL